MEKHQNQSDFDLVKNSFFENKPNCFSSPGASPLSRTLEETLLSPFLVNEMFWTQHQSPLHLSSSFQPVTSEGFNINYSPKDHPEAQQY